MAIKKKSPNEYWEEGKALADSIFEFGSTEIIEKYDAINDLPNSGVPDFSSPEQIEKYPAGILGTFSAIVDVIKISETKISTRNALRQQLIDEIYRDIKSGELIGIGFRSPRYTYRQPVIIPKDVFDSRNVDWENSTCEGGGLKFVAVRIALSAESNSTPAELIGVTINNSTSKMGRPSHRSLIQSAYKELLRDKKINENTQNKRRNDLIREQIGRLVKSQTPILKGLSDKTINDELKKYKSDYLKD